MGTSIFTRVGIIVLEKKEKKQMNQQVKEMLTRIYNTLALISTKGEDTLVMADCLRAIQQIVDNTPIIEEKVEVPNEE